MNAVEPPESSHGIRAERSERLRLRGVQDGLRPGISPRTTPSRSYCGLFIVTWRADRARCRVAFRSASAQVRDIHGYPRRGQANARCGLVGGTTSCRPFCHRAGGRLERVGVTYARGVPHCKALGISRPRHSGPVLRVSEQRRGTCEMGLFSRGGGVLFLFPQGICWGKCTRGSLLGERSGRTLRVYAATHPAPPVYEGGVHD